MQQLDAHTEYFIRMMLPCIKQEAMPFLKEECCILNNVINTLKADNTYQLAVVGAGTLSYIELAFEHDLEYVAIEPLSHIYIQQEFFSLIKKLPQISIINSSFGDFSKEELTSDNHIFAFIFNVFAYINDGIEKLNQYLNEGDIIIISTWNQTSIDANKIRSNYFNTIFQSVKDQITLPGHLSYAKLFKLDSFDFTQLIHYKSHQRIIGDITDILIIYC